MTATLRKRLLSPIFLLVATPLFADTYEIHGYIQATRQYTLGETAKYECKVVVKYEEDDYYYRYLAFVSRNDPSKTKRCNLQRGTEIEMLVTPNKRAPHKGEVITMRVIE